MNKILIIENEYASVKPAFDSANTLRFNDKLNFENISKAQEIDYHHLNDYLVIFIDISLAKRSDLDGFGIIEKIKSTCLDVLSRIVIITGNNKINDLIDKHNLSKDNITVLMKPIGFQEVEKIIREKGGDNLCM